MKMENQIVWSKERKRARKKERKKGSWSSRSQPRRTKKLFVNRRERRFPLLKIDFNIDDFDISTLFAHKYRLRLSNDDQHAFTSKRLCAAPRNFAFQRLEGGPRHGITCQEPVNNNKDDDDDDGVDIVFYREARKSETWTYVNICQYWLLIVVGKLYHTERKLFVSIYALSGP